MPTEPHFPPETLRQYALIADGQRGALLGPHGEVAFMCAPRWHDDAVFSSLIGGAGCFSVTPMDERHVWGGHYDEGSLIWRNRWVTTDSIIECREALALPGDVHRAVMVRRIIALENTAEVRIVFDARAGFGEHQMRDISSEGGIWTARSGGLYARLSGLPGARRRSGSLVQILRIPAGEWHDIVLELSDQPLPAEMDTADALWDATEREWTDAVPRLDATLSPRDARHSYAVLHGLTTAGGGMVAATTMSLPERADESRNYDYRYSWIRDQCFAGQAAAATGRLTLLDDAVQFVSARLLDDGPKLKPAYCIDGSRVPDERTLGLPGYPGGSDKVGNWVNEQFQLDALGETLLLFAAAAKADRLDVEHWHAVELAVDVIESRWGEPDAGIWEIDNRHWTHSRLICAAGLRAMGRADPSPRTAAWASLADAMVNEAAKSSLHPSGRWQRSPGDEKVDASLLLPAIRGAIPAEDPRSVKTWEAVAAELADSGYVYRFRHDARELHLAEGAFLLCGFHMALATHQQGDEAQALRWFERNRSACGPPGLFTEEFDVVQRQLRGNLPQAFVHAAMLESACRLAYPWRDDPAPSAANPPAPRDS